MKGISFPIFKTKIEGVSQRFQLEDPAERRKYFDAKAGKEIGRLREFLQKNTFVGFLLGPKNSGKGTYSKLFMEAIGSERVAHISVGDIVRSAQHAAHDMRERKKLIQFLEKHYRGFVKTDEVIKSILDWSVTRLLATEAILSLVEWEIGRMGRRALFIDGFPRNLDQVSLSLYLRSIMGYRDDPDFLVFIDVPEAVINERMKYRVICPLCQTPRNIRLLRTKEIKYDTEDKKFHLLCDNPQCEGYGKTGMVSKKGDELGIEAIRDRIEVDGNVMKMLIGLEGVPKVYLRNSVPVNMAGEYIDDYEITPAYRYELDEKNGVRVIEEPWTVKDDEGKESYSLLPAPVALALIKQTAKILGL